ncbi:transposase [Rickettsia sp. MEAM1 (Bemisia tabaci)]|uniref:IS256 family transposase n=1 Tax=Rickettsia sp. MEAM1 (Bemisia tabaci) TaxID=1182263 RepID=UPI000BBFAC2F|nr:IS256 family transposase [Rickettsia sp. MEAM1 (Bemisia tabaci)]ASX27979.1 transposase [Rickettsia sp. MEAM1 (Bemisia tabaci)]
MKNNNKVSNPAIEKLVSEILSQSDPSEIFGKEGIFQGIKKQIVNKILEKEMESHIGYEKHSKNEKYSDNRRNGNYEKTLIDPEGRKLTVEVPRDRDGEFEPQLIPKGVRKFEGFDDKVISLYARGMTIREIQGHLEELYATKVSSELISKVTDGILEEVTAWQNRALDNVYPIMYLDCIHVKARDNHVIINKAVYLAIGVNMEGKKELLGIWIGKNEGCKFWMQVVTELKNRGVAQIYVACVDGLKGFPEAINSIFPKTIVQLCIVHMVRNSVKYVSYKDLKAVTADLKAVYYAINEAEGLRELQNFAKKWDEKYPVIFDIWQRNWSGIAPFFSFPEDIRKAIYTTNAIESTNRQIRKIIKNKGVFPDDKSIQKIIFLALTNASKKWTMPIKNWAMALNQFAILCDTNLQNWANGEIVLTQKI